MSVRHAFPPHRLAAPGRRHRLAGRRFAARGGRHAPGRRPRSAPTTRVTRGRRPGVVAAFALVLALPAVARAAQPPAAPARGLRPDPPGFVTPDRTFDTIHTRLELDVDVAGRRIAGRVTHRLRAIRSRVTTVSLNCVELDVDGVEVDGRPADYDYPVPGDRTTAWLGRTEPSREDDRLVVHLPRAFAWGDTFTVTVRYHGRPRKGLHWIGPEKGNPSRRLEVWSQGEGEDTRYWIPCRDYPDDHATYEGVFRVPRGFFALSNGELVSRRDVGDRTEYRWRLDRPHVSYLIMLAAARYRVVEDRDGRVPLMFVVPPGTGDDAVARAFGLTRDMLTFFERITGIPYPWPKYAQVAVQDFIYGGMENTSATTMNLRVIPDASLALTDRSQGLVAHELAHQWWGDYVTCREWSHMWLNEGFATYYERLYREYHDGEAAFRYAMHRTHRQVVERDRDEPRPIVTEFFNRRGPRNNANIYIKGASVLHMLRATLGDDDFHRVIRRYAEANRFGPVDTYDLMRAVREVTGRNLDGFFEQWVFLAGHPDFRVRERYDGERSVLTLRVEQTQETGDLVPVFRVPVTVEIATDSATVRHAVLVEDARETFTLHVDSRPRYVLFDPDDVVLKTLDFPKPVDELLAQLDGAGFVGRLRAVEALARHGADDRAVPALIAVLAGDGPKELRGEAAHSLSRIGSADARRAITRALAGDASAHVRRECARALRRFERDDRAADALRRALARDGAVGVRAAALESLVALRVDDARRLCERALKDRTPRATLRRAALAGLAALEDPDALDAIRRYARPGNPRHWRHDAIRAYGRLARQLDSRRAREAAARTLEAMLDDDWPRTRTTVIAALRALGEKRSIPALERVADADPLASVRRAARSAARAIESAARERTRIGEVERRLERLEHRLDAIDGKGDDED